MFNNTKRNRILVYCIAFIVLSIISYLTLTMPSKDYSLTRKEKIDLNHGWEVEYEGNIIKNVSFPYDLNLEENTPYTARLILPEDFKNHVRLRIRSSMQDLIVYVDGEEVFRDIKEMDGKLVVPDASLWHLFELPNDIGGKELKLEMKSPAIEFSGILNEVYAGEGKDLIYDIVRDKIFNLSLSVLFIIFGIITLGLSFILKNLEDNRLLYLGVFSILVALWIFSESKIMQIFIGNRFILGGLSYMLIPMIPMTFGLFLKESVLKKYKDIMVVFAFMFMANLLINIYLQLSGIASFISSMQLTLVLIVSTLIGVSFFMVLEWRKYGNRQARQMLIYSSILSVFLLIEIIVFLSKRFERTSLFSGIGLLIFFTQITYTTFKSVNNMMIYEKETEILKKLAYKDILTNMGNRAAFEKHIDGLRKTNNKKPFRLTMMDINNLKFINDNYGHQEGDTAIKICSNIIEKYLQPFGECFRIGGDEFACIIFDLEDEDFNNQVSKMKMELENTKIEYDYKLDIAIGSNIYCYDEHNDIGSFIHETDLKMYQNKRITKTVQE